MNLQQKFDMAELGHLMATISERVEAEGLPGRLRIRALQSALEASKIAPRAALADLSEDQAGLVCRVTQCFLADLLRHHEGAQQAG